MGEVERVYVELEQYDGPWAGVADVGGVPHYFSAVPEGQDLDKRVFRVWPIAADDFALERERWIIFVGWNDQFEEGATHPGVGGIDSRYDELERLLEPSRQSPANARALRLERVSLAAEVPRYDVDGVDYAVRWRVS